LAISTEFEEFVRELFAPVAPVRVKRMFGGAGVFIEHGPEQVMFALVVNEVIFLKVDDTNRSDFEEEGQGPFVYETKDGKRSVMSYYEIPERFLDEPEELIPWARKAIDVALRNHKPKKSGPKKPQSKSPKPPKSAKSNAAKTRTPAKPKAKAKAKAKSSA
jgi:DNA transformation protein